MDTIKAWLSELGLSQYAEIFQRNDIGPDLLESLTDQDLRDVGVQSLGHRKKLLKAIAQLSESEKGAPASVRRIHPLSPASVAQPSGEGERRQLTVMFCDLVGSTELSQRLDPEDLREVLRAYQDTCAEVIDRFDGHVAQTLGDGLMVYFGYPSAHEDDAQRAVCAGLEIIDRIRALSRSLEAPPATPVAVRIGVHTGLVVAGEVSARDTRGDMAVVGETPNVAARLQAMAEPNTLVIGERTHLLAGAVFAYEDLGAHRLKGVTEPVRLFRVRHERAAESRFEATHRATLTPLVGREEEIGLLMRRWEHATAGDGQVVLLSGEPGIGKSRLVASVRERLRAQPHARIQCQCSPFFVNSAFYPLIEHLQRAAEFQPDEPADAKLDKLESLLARSSSAVTDVAPLLAALLSLSTEDRYPPIALSPRRQKERTIGVFVDQVKALAAQQPVLIVFEDVHWIDPSTLEVLDLLVSGIAAVRALVLITFRPEFVPSWGSHAHVTAYGLNRLSMREATTMVERVARGKALPEAIQSQIVSKADGVPLFIEELTKAVLEADWLVDRGDRYELAATHGKLDIPATLHDSLMARLDRLIPVKEVAQIGAAIGREFSYEMIAAVSSKGERELRDALDRFVKSDLVSRRGQPPEGTYVFKHALIQEAAYQSMLRSVRQRVHQQIAEAIVERFPAQADAQPEVVAHHYTQAGLGQPAVEYWERAGRRDVARSAYAEALAHFDEALSVLSTLPETSERTQRELRLQVARGFAIPAVKGWGTPEGKLAFQQALELAQDTPDSLHRFGASWGLWSVHTVGTDHQRARYFAQECVAMGQRIGDAGLLVEGYLLLGISLLFLGDLADARIRLEACIANYDPARHRGNAFVYGQDPKAAVGLYLPPALCMLGYPNLGLRQGQELLDFTRPLAHPHSLAFALAGMAWSHICCQDWQAAQRVADELIAKSSEQGFPFWESLGHCFAGRALVHQGASAAGAERLQEGLAELKTMGMGNFYTVCMAWPAEAAGIMGQAREGLGELADTLNLLDNNDQRYAESELYWIKATLLEQLAPPDAHEAEAWYRKAIDVARRQKTKLLELRAATSLSRLWQQQGKHAQARELLAPIHNWFTDGLDTKDLKQAKLLLEKLRY